jgi:hypothetical protein
MSEKCHIQTFKGGNSLASSLLGRTYRRISPTGHELNQIISITSSARASSEDCESENLGGFEVDEQLELG